MGTTVTIPAATLERLRKLSKDGGIGFENPNNDPLVEVTFSDDVFDAICAFHPAQEEIDNDEDVDVAINAMLDSKEQRN